jgi:hypothetical protein
LNTGDRQDAMHNEEGKLFDLVFHRLLALGVALVTAAALVWMVWATVRAASITREAPMPRAPADGGSLAPRAPDKATALAGDAPNPMIRLVVGPLTALADRAAGRLDRVPRALARVATDFAFFVGGPS